MNHSLQTSATNPVLTRDPATVVEDLLREILQRLDSVRDVPGPVPDHLEHGGAVVLDIQVDGIAYKLLRDGTAGTLQRAVLSPREQEIVRLVAKGLPSKAIADVLDMSLWTVGSHLRRVFAKLGVGTRAEMVARTLEDGLLEDQGSGPHD